MIRILILTLLIIPLIASGQNKFCVTGQVMDSSMQKITGANVFLFTTKDTFLTVTDSIGKFGFRPIDQSSFVIKISILGYETFINQYIFNSTSHNITLPIIFLKTKFNTLKEVIVKSRISPITLNEDTIEYAISQYHLRENAQLNDLLKRLPGIEVDKYGNIKFMGKSINKIKVNGREFLVGNIQDLLKLIPLEALEKIQVIDDYDKMAELTGRNTTNNNKVLNLQTKKNVNSTENIKAEIGLGTNKRYVVDILASSLEKNKQIIINGLTTNAIPGSGETNNKKGILLFRNQLNQSLYTNGGLLTEHSKHDEQVYDNIINITSEGDIKINTVSQQEIKFDNYNFAEAIDFKDQKGNNISTQLIVGKRLQSDKGISHASQTGIQYLDQSIENRTNKVQPNTRGIIYGSHNFICPGEVLAFGFNYNFTGSKIDQNIINKTRYYNNGTIALDSLLYQMVSKTNKLKNLVLQASYVKPLSTNSSMEINYALRSNSNIFTQKTQWMNKEGEIEIIDSLSNEFNYLKVEQRIGTNYKKVISKFDYILGVNFFLASYGPNRSKWLLPTINLNYKIDQTSRLTFRYEGRPIYPDYNQISPIPDRSNPLFPILGNPNLKASTSNLFTLDYNKVSKSIFLISLSASHIFSPTVSNTLTKKDTFNTVIQETHYLNAKGVYSLSGNYSWSRFFSEGKYQLFLDGTGNFNKNIFFLEHQRNNSQNITITQSLRIGFYKKWIDLNSGIGYTHNRITYSNPFTSSSVIGSWNISFNTKFFVSKSWSLSLDITKQINTGYANGVSANPLDLGASLEKTLLKNIITCRLKLINLLNQNTSISQTISANTTTQTRTNQLGRYILLSAILDLKKTKK